MASMLSRLVGLIHNVNRQSIFLDPRRVLFAYIDGYQREANFPKRQSTRALYRPHLGRADLWPSLREDDWEARHCACAPTRFGQQWRSFDFGHKAARHRLRGCLGYLVRCGLKRARVFANIAE